MLSNLRSDDLFFLLLSDLDVRQSDTYIFAFHFLLQLHLALEQNVTVLVQHFLFQYCHAHYSYLPIQTGLAQLELHPCDFRNLHLPEGGIGGPLTTDLTSFLDIALLTVSSWVLRRRTYRLALLTVIWLKYMSNMDYRMIRMDNHLTKCENTSYRLGLFMLQTS